MTGEGPEPLGFRFESIDQFLEGFPSVSRRQVIAFLGEAEGRLVASVYECVDWRLLRDLPDHDVKTARQSVGRKERSEFRRFGGLQI